MPKTYSKEQRQEIKERLRKEANLCLIQYGIKKTTVDMLVERVAIPKGTFYLFYRNKEELFFEVMMEIHITIETEFTKQIAELNQTTDIETYIELFMQTIQKAMDTCLMHVMTDSDFMSLVNKIPQDVIDTHFLHDNDLVETFLANYPHKSKVDKNEISAAFRAIFMLFTYQKGIGDEHFLKTIRFLLRGILLQIQ